MALSPSADDRQAADRLLGALDAQQQQVAMRVTGPLCVRAGAGTGKTRAITYRIAYGAAMGAVDPSTVLAVTFTTKAAAEMGSRLRELGAGRATARTFHSAALAQLRHFWPVAYGGQMPGVASHKASLVAAAAQRVGISADKALVRDLSAEIEWSKVSIVDASRYAQRAMADGRTPPGGLEAEMVAKIIDAYEQGKDERGVIDFEDILSLTTAMLARSDDIARSVRSRYRSFVVDEYQDVSPIQHRLLELWLGDRKDICVVGDVAQTIYSFTGASSRYLETFPQWMSGAQVVELVRDYRSTPQIVAVANQVVGSARGMDGRSRVGGLKGSVRLVAGQPTGPAVRFNVYDSDEEEAAGITRRIREVQAAGTRLSEIAILYRTNAQSRLFEEALGAEGINYQVHGGARFFDREEVRRAVMLLRQQARVSALAEDTGLKGEPSLLEQVEEVVSTLGWSPQPPTGEGAVRERWSNLDALVQMARSRRDLSLAAFFVELQERAENKAAPQIEGVTLSSLHAAKGLEWEAVFLGGCSEGLIPISLATTPEAIEEERRLLYVGITRAKRELQISWSRSKGGGGRNVRKVSRFLGPLWPAGDPSNKTRRLAGGQRRKTEEQEFQDESDQATLELYEQLRQWRKDTADAMGRPAYTVLPNTTLRDIATARPKTMRQLGVLRGIGDVKLTQFGAEILKTVREIASDN
ncbi:ATP-dependent DNA helicase UvrD2 [Actinomycetaceae bacterium MB13-C1-2]|nr:ATP-dependent DNA helicase UvrD2 [Actinomycetaceae bacterium MB13-C1-2]